MIRDILNLLSKDSLQVQAMSACYEMLDICHQMVTASVKSLRESDDAGIDLDIYEMDKTLNAFERDVRRKVLTHLSVSSKADISTGLSLVSIVIDLERIGDYTKNIHDLAVHHPKRLHGGELEDLVASLESAALDQFSRMAKAFKEGDIEEARTLMEDYKEDVSKIERDLENRLLGEETKLEVNEAVALALYARFLKRIAAHSRNLASSLVNPVDRIGYPEKPSG